MEDTDTIDHYLREHTTRQDPIKRGLRLGRVEDDELVESYDSLALQLLGIDALPLPRTFAARYSCYLDAGQDQDLCNAVCELVPGVNVQAWREAHKLQRMSMMRRALAACSARMPAPLAPVLSDETHPLAGSESQGAEPSKIDQAIALKRENPDWTQKQIAGAVGCSEANLSKSPKYKAVCEAIKNTGLAAKMAGQQTYDPSGDYSALDVEFTPPPKCPCGELSETDASGRPLVAGGKPRCHECWKQYHSEHGHP